jgi:L,D-transpeptidase ErfK/SrfK
MKHTHILLLLALALPTKALAAYDLPYMGELKTIETDYEDTFAFIARDYNLGYLDLILANPEVDPWIPGDGTKLKLPTQFIFPDAPKEGIVINLAEMRLYAFINGDKEPVTFPIGVGREGLETPTGTTTIVRKQANPIWRPTPRMREEDPKLPAVVGPGPENPLGTHALYLGWPQYLIHGTNKPFGIGRRVSSGCIRMYPEAIIKMFSLIEPNTKVTVVSQPIKAAWINDVLYMEAHPSMIQSTEIEEKGVIQSYPLTDEDKAWISNFAGAYADQLDWDKISELAARRTGIPTAIFSLKKAEPVKEKPVEKELPKEVKKDEAPEQKKETPVKQAKPAPDKTNKEAAKAPASKQAKPVKQKAKAPEAAIIEPAAEAPQETVQQTTSLNP